MNRVPLLRKPEQPTEPSAWTLSAITDPVVLQRQTQAAAINRALRRIEAISAARKRKEF
ncbi:hypothetical protein SEA_SPOOKY_102 [Gordonia phage Spooky]|nr:hypothetical protein SEA_SPOOKY_102 [Gordonia phage Spooky]